MTSFNRYQKALVSILFLFCSSTALAEAENKALNNNENLLITDSTFQCIRKMTRVRGLYVGSLTGNIKETLMAANAKEGAEYPRGSVVQLVPTEVMVKRKKGFNPVTKDWEFFELSVSKEGSKIDKRGFADVVNRFGGNCFGCHIKAKPQWDFICEKDHGCDPIALTSDMISFIQKTDPRCEENESLTENEIKAAAQLKKMMGG